MAGSSVVNKSLEIFGLSEERARFKRLLLTNPDFDRRIKEIIDTTLRAVRSGVVKDARGVMNSDPRKAQRAVRRSVYKKILGGQVNILAKRKAGRELDLQDANANQWWRKRGYKTGQMSRYYGSDRGFILRFLNKGTVPRVSPTMDAHDMYRKSISERPEWHNRKKGEGFKSSVLGFRGKAGVKSRDFFDNSKYRMMDELPTLEQLISDLIEQEFNR